MPALRVYPQQAPLRGQITVPGDKSISHRAVMLASLAQGQSAVRRWLPAGDTQATLDAMRALGVEIVVHRLSDQAWNLQIAGRGLHGLMAPQTALDCRNAGTCMRLLAGILAGQRFPSILDGSEQLRKRPMRRIVAPLRQMGAQIEAQDGRAPLRITPSSLAGMAYEMPVASAQVKSAVLLAGLYSGGETRVREPGPARDHTERMLRAMGVSVQTDGDCITLQPPAASRPLQPLDITVPGDISSAAFLLVAAATVPHSRVDIQNVGINETRTGLLNLLGAMGADIGIGERRASGGEPVADLTAAFAELHGAEVGGDLVVRAIDEFPIWAVAATQAAGRSVLRDAAELRVKEVDRIERLATELRRMNVPVTERDDGFIIEGPLRPRGATVDSHGDHRLGMALAVAGLLADGPTTIAGAGCISDSFPGFVQTMNALGAHMEWIEES
ncbi:MAG: 3-phosphoshikimate 1-carboxyvinyltransferase [Chloroflexota bacterium]